MWIFRSLLSLRQDKTRRTTSRGRRSASRRKLRVECLENRMLLSAAPEDAVAELPEDAGIPEDNAPAEVQLADNSTTSESASGGSAVAEASGTVQPVVTAASPAGIGELQVDADGVLEGTVLPTGVRACWQVELDVDSDGAADLYTYTNDSDGFRHNLGALLGAGSHIVQARVAKAGAGPGGIWQAITFECQARLDGGTVPDLVARSQGAPLKGLWARLQGQQVNAIEAMGLLASPPGPPGGGGGQQQTGPVITSFSAVAGLYGTWIFEGTVEHEQPWTVNVVFGGVLAGRQTSVHADGTFAYSEILPSGTSGIVSAQAFDLDGIGSNIAYDWVA